MATAKPRKRKPKATATATTLAPADGTAIGTIAGVDVYEFVNPKQRLEWTAKMAIDCDGSGGNPDGDPYYQDDTTLHHNGEALNPYEVPFIVVPPMVRDGVKPVVMGCMALAINLENGEVTQAVVGDLGPKTKIGEASCRCAENVGLDGNPNHGGTDSKIVRYIIWPGIPAVVDGVKYRLQPA